MWSLAIALGLWPALAGAAEIRWSGALECRRELEVAEQVEAMTGRPLAEVDVADFALELASVDDSAIQLTLVTTPRGGAEPSRRTFASGGCVDVTDAVAVAIALTIGEAPTPVVAPSAASPAPNSTTLASRPSAERPAERTARPSATPTRWSLGLGIGVDSAVTPQPVLGGAARVAVERGRFRAELEGGAFAASRVVDARGRGGSFQLMYAAPLVCVVSPLGVARATGCAGYELGRLTATGEGISNPYERVGLWQALRGELGALVPLTESLWLSGRIGAAVALVRPRFVLDEAEAVHRSAPVSLRASAGLELAL